MFSKMQEAHIAADLWRTVALHREAELCRADWRRRLGGAYGALAGFLTEMPGTVAESYPDPKSGLPLIPRRVHDGTYTARPDDGDATAVPGVTGLRGPQVARWRLDWEMIAGDVAGCLGLRAHRAAGPLETPWVRDIGSLRVGEKVWAGLLLVARNRNEALGWARHLLHGGPWVFIPPSHDPVLSDLVRAHGHRCVSLDRDMRFARVKGAWALQAAVATGDIAGNPTPATAWSKHAIEKVEIVGEFKAVRFADGFEISFFRQARRRAYLAFLMKRCLASGEFDFDYETVRSDFNDAHPALKIKTDRLQHDLFRNCNGFERLFDVLDLRSERYRLLIRPR